MKSCLIFFLSFTLMFSQAFAASSAPPTELKIATAQEFDTLNRMMSMMMVAVHIGAMVNRTLARPDAEMKWKPQLAESIPSLENKQAKIVTINGKKQIVATWVIKDSARWGDGQPVTCKDFQFTLEVINNPLVPVSSKSDYDLVQKIDFDPKKPKNCLFTYAEAHWDFFKLGSFIPLPEHLERPAYEKFKNEKEGYAKNTLYSKDITNPGLYNGPYVVKDYKPGNYLLLEPNPYFYGSAPQIKRVVVRVIANTSTIDANLRTQEVNMSFMGMTLDQFLDFENVIKAQSLPYTIVYKQFFNYEHLLLDLQNDILKDLKVRKALMHATNRPQMNTSFYGGKQTIADSYVSSFDPWYNSKVTKYDYSLKKSNALLDSAGWIMGTDGFRHKNGKKLEITMMTTAGNKIREDIEVYLKEEWKKIGVDVVIKNQPPRTLFGESIKKRSYNGIVMMGITTQPEKSLSEFFLSTNIATQANSYTGANHSGWINHKVDELLKKIDLEFNAKKRKEMAQEIQKIYMDEVVTIPLFFRTDGTLIPKNMTGYVPTGHYYSETNEIEKWKLTE